ncbi:hypothetical protein RB599_010059 [Gaeumannomyces hyphopodioides]
MPSSVWKSDEVEREFHELSSKLHNTQCEEKQYSRDSLNARAKASAGAYVLSLRHELKLGNHLALLAHSQEGAPFVSAVCLQKTPRGLIVRVASNEKPDRATISKLQAILNTLSRYTRNEIRRDDFMETVSEQVLSLSQTRIQQRIKSQNMAQNLETVVKRLKDTARSLGELRVRVSELQGQINSDRKSLLEVVRKAQRVSSSPDWKTAMNLVGLGGMRRSMEEVDKIARYINLCEDMEKLACWPEYRRQLGSISVVPCERFKTRKPPGADKKCHVHAEVQLIMFYKQWRDTGSSPPPRAIGCSKSACYLCHLLNQRLGKYVVSSTHGRLYPQWTIPQVTLPLDKGQELQGVVHDMKKDLHEIERRIRKKQHRNRDNPPESRPQSALSDVPAASQPLVAVGAVQGKLGALSVPPSSPAAPVTVSGPSKRQGDTEAVEVAEEKLQGVSIASSSPASPLTVGGPSEEQGVAEAVEEATKKEPRARSVASSSTTTVATVGGPSRQSPVLQHRVDAESSRRSLDGTEPGDEEQETPQTEVYSSSVSSLHLEEANLPYEHHMGIGTLLFELKLGSLTVSFDCVGVAAGRLRVAKSVDDGDVGGADTQIMGVADIPTTEDLTVGCPEGSRTLRMRLRSPGGTSVDIEVQWGDYPGRKTELKRVKKS